MGKGETPVLVPPRSVVPVHVDALFHGFVDTTYAYRFGPPGHDLVFLELVDEGGEVLARAHHLPLGVGRPVERELGLEARFEEGGTRLVLRAKRLALFAALDLEGRSPPRTSCTSRRARSARSRSGPSRARAGCAATCIRRTSGSRRASSAEVPARVRDTLVTLPAEP